MSTYADKLADSLYAAVKGFEPPPLNSDHYRRCAGCARCEG